MNASSLFQLDCRADSSSAIAIRTTQLSKTYGDTIAVDNLSIDVNPGELVALLGPNGAGKTTTLKLLLGLLQPTSGHAHVFGLDCARDSLSVKGAVGYVPDEPAFYDFLTGEETLEFIAQVRGLPRARAMVELAETIAALQFEHPLTQLVGGYSLGMKKKLAILASILHRPRLLLLDEPTNGLDPQSAATVKAVLRAMSESGVAVLLSTHLLDMADRLCDRGVVLGKGRLLFDGRLQELREQSASGGSSTLEDAFLGMIRLHSEEQ
ncbi:MAG: ABC transporter ATP-binding protein [Deltaproteobacteria bacterium]|nr:ABC transporter ATP-binding protein [Deltaproteobacteria bacterium]